MKRLALAVVLALSCTFTQAQTAKPKVRAITAFVRLDAKNYQHQLAEALAVLHKTEADFKSQGYEVETIRFTTQYLDSFRVRWIAALDKNRSIGAPYWPESFWTTLKAEMQKIDLFPMFVTFYQHGISNELMQEVLDSCHTLGSEHFQGSPACFKLGDAELAMTADIDKLKLAKTSEVLTKVYDIYKPQIKAARVRYLAEHPDWVDK